MTTQLLSASALASLAPTTACATIIASVGKAIALYAKHKQRQRDYEQLLSMSEHQFRDIGLTRSEVLRSKSESKRLFSC